MLQWDKMLQNGKKELKIHQVKMLPWDKMSQFMGKIGHKHIRTNCNKGMKCHRIGWLYYREIKCHIVTFRPNFWV